jgi:hypothetical protein
MGIPAWRLIQTGYGGLAKKLECGVRVTLSDVYLVHSVNCRYMVNIYKSINPVSISIV